MNSMTFILLSLGFYSAAIMLLAAASRSANIVLVTAIANTLPFLLPSALVLANSESYSLAKQRNGILLALLGGLAITGYTLAVNKSYSIEKVAVVAPIVMGGAVVLTAILGLIIYKEKVTLLQGVGLVGISAGLLLVAYARASGK
jgi:drug/metabolite transporter (DMT)-like permease